MSWIAGSHTHGCWLGTYEIQTRRCFEKYVGKGDVVYDIGAHVGFYTLTASALVGSQGTVVSFEPLPRNLDYLIRHVSLNSLENVRILAAACTDENGLAGFEVNRKGHAQGHLSEGRNLYISTVTLDKVWEREAFPSPDHMKIDVEGGERNVLRGGADVIQKFHPTIFLSLHSLPLYEACVALLETWNYQIEPLTGPNEEGYPPEIVAQFKD